MKYSTALFLIAVLFTIALLLVSLRGCAPEPPVDPPRADACATGRWIGITAAGSCPSPPGGAGAGWSSRPLFPGADAGSTLGSFCLYEHDDPSRGNELDRLVGTGDLERVGPDCAEVFVAGTPPVKGGVTEASVPILAPRFAIQAGAVSLPPPSDQEKAGSVRLAILDTSPEAQAPPFEGGSEHGASLAYMARELLCRAGDDACAAKVTTRLALPVVSLDPNGSEPLEIDDVNGGYFGTLGQLAEAIVAEVTSWKTSESEDRLVVNLSLGWNPRPEDATGDLGTDAQAVLDALQDAACRGVLVVAAAGNLGSGPDAQTGPILPAAWQSRETPSEIQAEGGSTSACVDSANDDEPNPLLYAAGAIDSRGRPLSNHRPGAEPSRVAYGSYGVTDSGDEWTGIYTGTSVSTAVISATAAAVWHYDQGLSRRELMGRLHDSGDDLEREASFDPGESVRRISLCSAIAASGEIEPCPAWSPSAPSLPYEAQGWKSYDASVVQKPIDLHSDDDKENDDCPKGEYLRPAGYLPASFCPFRDIPGVDDHPSTGPQPEDIPCPSCPLIKDPDAGDGSNFAALGFPSQGAPCPASVETPYTLYIEIDPDWAGGTLTDATLRIDDRFLLLDLGEQGLEQGSQLAVHCIEGKDIDLDCSIPGAACSTADLTFTASEHGSVMNVIPISADS